MPYKSFQFLYDPNEKPILGLENFAGAFSSKILKFIKSEEYNKHYNQDAKKLVENLTNDYPYLHKFLSGMKILFPGEFSIQRALAFSGNPFCSFLEKEVIEVQDGKNEEGIAYSRENFLAYKDRMCIANSDFMYMMGIDFSDELVRLNSTFLFDSMFEKLNIEDTFFKNLKEVSFMDQNPAKTKRFYGPFINKIKENTSYEFPMMVDNIYNGTGDYLSLGWIVYLKLDEVILSYVSFEKRSELKSFLYNDSNPNDNIVFHLTEERSKMNRSLYETDHEDMDIDPPDKDGLGDDDENSNDEPDTNNDEPGTNNDRPGTNNDGPDESGNYRPGTSSYTEFFGTNDKNKFVGPNNDESDKNNNEENANGLGGKNHENNNDKSDGESDEDLVGKLQNDLKDSIFVQA